MSLPGLFVTGTDTGVGKTRVAAAIARRLVAEGYRVGVLKPVATDVSRPDDADLLIEAIGGGVPLEQVVPIRFEQPLAPVVAARLSGTPLEQDRVNRAVAEALDWWSDRADVVIVEGVGGLLCPLAEGTTVADLAIRVDYPLIVVARRGLGTLNHTLLTIEAARRRELRVAGVVLNGSEPTTDPLAEATNPVELSRRLNGVSVLADIPYTHDDLACSTCLACVDWYGRCSPARIPVDPARSMTSGAIESR